MVNQVVLAVALGVITGLVVVLIYLLVQFLRRRSSREKGYKELPASEPNVGNRAILKSHIPTFYIPQPVLVQQPQPIKAELNDSTHLPPSAINLSAINTGSICSPRLDRRKLPEKRKPSPPQTYQPGTPIQRRKVAVPTKKPESNLGKLEFSLYYDEAFRLLQVYVMRGIKIANSEDDISPDVLVIASLTFNENHIWEQKTKTVKKTNDPQFNEKLEAHNIIAAKLRESVLHFQLFDDRTHKIIGEIDYSLKEIPSNKSTNQTLPLFRDEIVDSGDEVFKDDLPDMSAGLGDLLISLCHNPTDQKLTVKINCARSLQPLTGRLNPFVKLDVTFCGKKLGSRTTKVAHNTRAPNFGDVFVFDMHTDKLPQVTLIFKVKHRGKVREVNLGTVHLGYCVNVESEYRHWEQVLEKPHLEIEQWHAIQEYFVE